MPFANAIYGLVQGLVLRYYTVGALGAVATSVLLPPPPGLHSTI